MRYPFNIKLVQTTHATFWQVYDIRKKCTDYPIKQTNISFKHEFSNISLYERTMIHILFSFMKIWSYQIRNMISELSYVSAPLRIIFCHVSLILHFINISHVLHIISTNFLKQILIPNQRDFQIFHRAPQIFHIFEKCMVSLYLIYHSVIYSQFSSTTFQTTHRFEKKLTNFPSFHRNSIYHSNIYSSSFMGKSKYFHFPVS
jgi:hypothetical protein